MEKKRVSPKKQYEYSNRRKQVLQNKPVTFRPTNQQLLKFINKEQVGMSKTKIIRLSLDFREAYEEDPCYFILELIRKHPELARIANNRHKNEVKKGMIIYGKKRQ